MRRFTMGLTILGRLIKMTNNDGNDTNKSDKQTVNNENKIDSSRRNFIKNTGIALGGVVGGSVLGGVLTNQYQTDKSGSDTKESNTENVYNEARMFFTRYEDFATLAQSTECIYPENDNGPGAIALGVPYFIDKQLAGPWGMNAREFRHAPFAKTNVSTDQSRLTRGELFIIGVRKMNQLSQERFDTPFYEADEEQQIDILEDFEEGEVEMAGADSGSFFELLRGAVLEGAYSDPLYGGNRNMEGWKMKEFPGPVASYTNVIESDKFVEMDPISLTDYQQK